MADLDYGEIRIYPGNYDDYMLASTQARERLVANNAKAKERVAELQDFVRRFSANKSKSRQDTSRLKQIDRIKAGQAVVKQIGRAPCRERACQYVSTSVVAVSLQTQHQHPPPTHSH